MPRGLPLARPSVLLTPRKKAVAAQDRPHVVVLEIRTSPIEAGPEAEKSTLTIAYKFRNYGEGLATR
jgi:hypothetical protein